MNERSDEELIESVKKGSEMDFRVLYGRYKRPIYNYLYHFLENRSSAEDCAQDVFLRLYRKASKYDPVEGSFSSWLFRMAKNVALDLLRRNKLRRTQSLDTPLSGDEGKEFSLKELVASDAPDVHQNIETEERKLMLEKALWKLSAEDREPLILCDIEGMSHKKAAEILGCVSGTLTVRLFRARQKLAVILGWAKEDV